MRKKSMWIAGGLAAVAALAVALAAFQPWKLIVDKRADDPDPVAKPPVVSASPSAAGPAETVLFTTDTWKSYEHPTKGTVRIYALADGRRVLRLQDLDTSNGPDLKVYLSERPHTSGEFGTGFVSLGTLKGNKGSSNYAVPRETDLGKYQSVVIWCKRFSVPFGAAPLRPA